MRKKATHIDAIQVGPVCCIYLLQHSRTANTSTASCVQLVCYLPVFLVRCTPGGACTNLDLTGPVTQKCNGQGACLLTVGRGGAGVFEAEPCFGVAKELRVRWCVPASRSACMHGGRAGRLCVATVWY